MTAASTLRQTLLEEIDSRQDELLTQLDSLNMRIESVLREFTQRGEGESPAGCDSR